MRIVDGKRFYAAQIRAAVRIDNDGWDRYDGRNWQWYTLRYNPDCGLVILEADNSGDCYGDYETRYFSSPAAFRAWAQPEEAEYGWQPTRDVEALLGDIDEGNAAALAFVNAFFGVGVAA